MTVRHKGAVNALSAVEWLTSNLPSPELLFVTGCSAGAYASLLWAARLTPFYGPRGTRVVRSRFRLLFYSYLRDRMLRGRLCFSFVGGAPDAILPEWLEL